MHQRLAEAKAILRDARTVAVLTGAGVSAESGVPTFRGQNGLWQGLSVEDLATPEGFAKNPRRVWEWYNLRRHDLGRVQPNPGHLALVRLERQKPDFGLITQNVDRLHQRAGSTAVLELHGSIWEVRCTDCETTLDRTGVELPAEPRCPHCGGWLRPGVVWFGEMLPPGVLERAEEWAGRAQVFLVAGTSSLVYPAAGLAGLARAAGATVMEVNLEPTPITPLVHYAFQGKSGELLPELVPDIT